jgi:hypothetical protein
MVLIIINEAPKECKSPIQVIGQITGRKVIDRTAGKTVMAEIPDGNEEDVNKVLNREGWDIDIVPL